MITYESKVKGETEYPTQVAGVPLRDVEPLAHTGIYATVWRGNVDEEKGMQVVIKRHQVDPLTIDREITAWVEYKNNIESYKDTTGITVPKSLAFETEGDKVYFIDELACPVDVSKLLNDTTLNIEIRKKIVAELFRSLSNIPRDENHQLVFMIDGKFSNFCFNPDGTFSYVDTFPAHRRADDSKTLLHPIKDHIDSKRSIFTDSFITGDMYGVLGRFFSTLRKDHFELWESLDDNEYIRLVIEELPTDLRDYSTYLIENDIEFIQQLYRFNAEDKSDHRLYSFLNPES
jgi:hypothetical protein